MNLNGLLETVSFSPDLLQKPTGWIGHLPFADWLIRELSPKLFVELGTHFGHSYFAFCQSVAENQTKTQCYSVDTWQGDEHAGYYGDDVFVTLQDQNQKRYAEFSKLMRMTFDDAVAYFSDGSIDLLHIDGLHTYEEVRHDFETWLPKLAPGAVVLFHDTVVRERNFGVWKLWEELQSKYPNNLGFSHSHGLGVLQLNDAPDEKKLPWLQQNSSDKQKLKSYFFALAERQSERFELSMLRQSVSNLNLKIVEQENQILSLNQKIVEQENQIGVMKRSYLWKLAAPLRSLAFKRGDC